MKCLQQALMKKKNKLQHEFLWLCVRRKMMERYCFHCFLCFIDQLKSPDSQTCSPLLSANAKISICLWSGAIYFKWFHLIVLHWRFSFSLSHRGEVNDWKRFTYLPNEINHTIWTLSYERPVSSCWFFSVSLIPNCSSPQPLCGPLRGWKKWIYVQVCTAMFPNAACGQTYFGMSV